MPLVCSEPSTSECELRHAVRASTKARAIQLLHRACYKERDQPYLVPVLTRSALRSSARSDPAERPRLLFEEDPNGSTARRATLSAEEHLAREKHDEELQVPRTSRSTCRCWCRLHTMMLSNQPARQPNLRGPDPGLALSRWKSQTSETSQRPLAHSSPRYAAVLGRRGAKTPTTRSRAPLSRLHRPKLSAT